MKVNNSALYGIIFVLCLMFALLLNKKCEQKMEFNLNDANSKKIEKMYKDSISAIQVRIDSVLVKNDSLEKLKQKINYVYKDKINTVTSATIWCKDSILRTSLNIRR
jgi:hypothetical protein